MPTLADIKNRGKAEKFVKPNLEDVKKKTHKVEKDKTKDNEGGTEKVAKQEKKEKKEKKEITKETSEETSIETKQPENESDNKIEEELKNTIEEKEAEIEKMKADFEEERKEKEAEINKIKSELEKAKKESEEKIKDQESQINFYIEELEKSHQEKEAGNISAKEIEEKNDEIKSLKEKKARLEIEKEQNTITISQTEYNENSLSNMVLVIFTEAISKFGLDKNLFQMFPFEECFYDRYDEVIEIENEDEKLLQKPFANKYMIYDNDGFFKNDIKQEKERLQDLGLDFELIDGDFEKALERINNIRPVGTAIYTQNMNLAYQFVNLVHSPNVFVDSSLTNVEAIPDKKSKLYYMKKIMYPSGKDFNIEEYLKEFNA